MTRKDYEVFAQILGTWRGRAVLTQAAQMVADGIAQDLEQLFKKDNPRFNKKTFRDAVLKAAAREYYASYQR